MAQCEHDSRYAQELYTRQLVSLAQASDATSVPAEVDSYRHLCPLEPIAQASGFFLNCSSCVYKALSARDSLQYALRRLYRKRARMCSLYAHNQRGK
jgi:hypothetical protein